MSQIEILREILDNPGITRTELNNWHKSKNGSQVDSYNMTTLYLNRYVSRERRGKTFAYTLTEAGLRMIQNGEHIICLSK